jgi:hypothetical protein
VLLLPAHLHVCWVHICTQPLAEALADLRHLRFGLNTGRGLPRLKPPRSELAFSFHLQIINSVLLRHGGCRAVQIEIFSSLAKNLP